MGLWVGTSEINTKLITYQKHYVPEAVGVFSNFAVITCVVSVAGGNGRGDSWLPIRGKLLLGQGLPGCLVHLIVSSEEVVLSQNALDYFTL